jgi:hypothetical protein
MYLSLIMGLACYVLIGAVVVAFGPVKRRLDEAVADVRESRPTGDDAESRTASKAQILLFRIALSVAVVLLWGRFLIFVLKEHTEDKVGTAPRRTG